MEVHDRAARALISGLGIVAVGIAIVAGWKLVLFILDAPGWWILVLGLGLGGFAAQWAVDRPRPEEPERQEVHHGE